MSQKLLAALSIIIVAAALSFFLIRFERPIARVLNRWHNWHPLEGGFEIDGIPVLLYSNLPSLSPFTATVKSKTFEKATTTNQTERSLPASSPIAWMSVRVKKTDGKELAIVWQNPDSNTIAFGNSLREGHSYEFPLVINAWQRGVPIGNQ